MSLIGRKVRLSTTHSDGSVISYSARIVKVAGDGVWCEIPARVRALPFPPYGGHRYAKFSTETIEKLRKSGWVVTA